MKNLGKYELAAIKKAAASVRMVEARKARLLAKRAKIDEEIEDADNLIEAFEQPVRIMSGGFTSTEVLATIAEIVSGEGVQGGSSVDDTPVGEVEVPASEAVAINPEVVSPIEGDDTPFAGELAGGLY